MRKLLHNLSTVKFKLSASLALIAFPALAADIPAQEAAAHAVTAKTAGNPRSSDTLGPPELEVQRALMEINNAQRSLSSVKQLNDSLALGPQLMTAERAYKAAERYFRADEPLAVVHEVNAFLNLTPVSDDAQYLNALYMLGRAYQRLGMEQRAVRAYRRYVSAYLNSKHQDHQRFTDVLKLLLPLAAKHTAQTQGELERLLAALTSLQFEKEADGTLLYLSAQTAAQRGRTDLASRWLSRAAQVAGDPAVTARSWYYKALLALARREFAVAVTSLQEALKIEGVDSEMRELTYQALARTSIHLKRPYQAIENYRLISESSSIYREVLFELTYVHLELEQSEEARATAQKLVERYPESAEAMNLRTILAYLDLQAGDLEGAQQALAKSADTLAGIDHWLLTHLQNQRLVPFAVLNELVNRTALDLRRSPITGESQELFRRISEVRKSLSDIRGDVRDTLYTIGRAQVVHFRPVWELRMQQIDQIARDLLGAGHRLAATEALIHHPRLSAVELQRLQASSRRRQHLYSEQTIFRRQVSMWASWININKLGYDIGRRIEALHTLRSEINGLNFLASRDAASGAVRQDELARLVNSERQLMTNLQRSLELVRKKQVINMATRSEYSAVRSGFIQYANLLYEEATILQPYRDRPSDQSHQALSFDLVRAWQRWEYVARQAHDLLAVFHAEMMTELQETITRIQDLTAQHDALVVKVNELNDVLEHYLGDSVEAMISHYRSEIDQRLAKQRKWQAELEWLRYQRREASSRSELNEVHLQQQILRDNLDDMIQGVSQL